MEKEWNREFIKFLYKNYDPRNYVRLNDFLINDLKLSGANLSDATEVWKTLDYLESEKKLINTEYKAHDKDMTCAFGKHEAPARKQGTIEPITRTGS